MPVQVRQPAPMFKTLAYVSTAADFREIALEDYKGRWVCLYFYPNDFSPLCPTEVAAFSAAHGQFLERNCDVLGCSSDSAYVHRAWCESTEDLGHLKHPLLSDSTRRISMDYGVLVPQEGVALRGTFLIDPNGIIRWVNVNDLIIGRNIDEILRILDALQTDEPCPCGWQKGDPTLKA